LTDVAVGFVGLICLMICHSELYENSTVGLIAYIMLTDGLTVGSVLQVTRDFDKNLTIT